LMRQCAWAALLYFFPFQKNRHSYTYPPVIGRMPEFLQCRFVPAILHRTYTPTPPAQGSMVTHMPALRRLCAILIQRSPSTGITRLSAQPSASGDLGKPGTLAASPADSASFFHSAVRSPLHGFPAAWKVSSAIYHDPDARTDPGLSEWSYHLIWSWTKYRLWQAT